MDMPIILLAGSAPVYKTPGSAAMDLQASHDYTMQPWRLDQRVHKIRLGIHMAIPRGYYGMIHGRSGLASEGILAHTGVIDSDYRGEVAVMLFNMGSQSKTIKAGDRIAQLAIIPIMQVNPVVVAKLEETERGDGGFGSTGK
jgi:dUTP pyrophosphatase